GLAYKGNSDDIRNSPSYEFIEHIKDDVKEVRSYDPYVGGTHEKLEEAVTGADAIIIATDHEELKSLDWESIGKVMRSRVLIDGRHIIEKPPKGFLFKGIGRGEY
ncbi:nucleotide sugar dehydrogenase, partial [Thermococci archaeon]